MRARGFRSRALNSALARLAGCCARGGLPTRAPRPDDSQQVSGFAVAPLGWLKAKGQGLLFSEAKKPYAEAVGQTGGGPFNELAQTKKAQELPFPLPSSSSGTGDLA